MVVRLKRNGKENLVCVDKTEDLLFNLTNVMSNGQEISVTDIKPKEEVPRNWMSFSTS